MLISVLYLTVSRTLNRTVSSRELNYGGNTDLNCIIVLYKLWIGILCAELQARKETQQIIIIIIIIIIVIIIIIISIIIIIIITYYYYYYYCVQLYIVFRTSITLIMVEIYRRN